MKWIILSVFCISIQAQVYETGFLVVDGVFNSELVAPFDILEHSRYRDPQRFFRCFLVSQDGQPIKTAEGLRIEVDYSFANCPDLDVLVIPSGEHSMDTDLENDVLMQWVSTRVKQARIVMTLCDGAFVLAATEQLNGRYATTFPGDQDAFAEKFPLIKTQRQLSFVHDGKFITSVGGAKSYDPALFLTEKWFSKAIAERSAQGLVIDWQLDKLAHQSHGQFPPPPSAQALP